MYRRKFLQWLGVAPVVAALPRMEADRTPPEKPSMFMEVARSYCDGNGLPIEGKTEITQHTGLFIDRCTLVAEEFVAPPVGSDAQLVVSGWPFASVSPVFEDGHKVRLSHLDRDVDGYRITECWGTVWLDRTYGVNGIDTETLTQRYTILRNRYRDGQTMLAGTVVEPESLVFTYQRDSVVAHLREIDYDY